MARRLPDNLQELTRYGGTVHVKCRRCGRKAQFGVFALYDWFRSRRIRDDWKTIRTKFVCEGCGVRDAEVQYSLEAPDPPRPPPLPRNGDAPLGVDPDAWAKADHYERKRLIRRARN